MNEPLPNLPSFGVLQVTWCFPPTTGGVESHVADLSEALSRRGQRVVVLTGEESPVLTEKYTVISCPLLNWNKIRAALFLPADFATQLSACVEQVVLRYGISIIHVHNLHHFYEAPAAAPAAVIESLAAPAIAIESLRRSLGLRVFHSHHETVPELLRENRENLVYRSWNGNFAVSRHIQKQCEQILGFSPTLRPLGVNTSVFQAKSECLTSNLTPILLHPARLVPWKGVDISVRAVRLLLDQGYEIALILTNTQRIADWNSELVAYREKIICLIDELQLSKHVRFMDVSYSDMPQLYEQSDIVLYPTIGEEPYGLVPIEAMSCARPIIASDSGGIRETVADGVTGYIVPCGDASSVASRVAKLLDDPTMARQLGRAGRRHVEENFDAENYVSSLLEDYSAS